MRTLPSAPSETSLHLRKRDPLHEVFADGWAGPILVAVIVVAPPCCSSSCSGEGGGGRRLRQRTGVSSRSPWPTSCGLQAAPLFADRNSGAWKAAPGTRSAGPAAPPTATDLSWVARVPESGVMNTIAHSALFSRVLQGSPGSPGSPGSLAATSYDATTSLTA